MLTFPFSNRVAGNGFTLVELIVAIGIFSILATFATINLIRPQTKDSVDATTVTLVSDLKQAQIRTMAGFANSKSSAQNFGILINNTSYTLFDGASYVAGDSDNYVVNLPSGISMSTTLPSGQLLFDRKSGEVLGFVNGSNTITVMSSIGDVKVVTINRLGVVTIN